MELWRLYREAHGPGLDGTGGLRAAGRWHELGSRVVYFGASAAIAVLERLARVNPDALAADLILTRFEGDVSVEDLTDFRALSDLTQTRACGEQFLKARRACVLRVPSIILPEEHNLLFNPVHPDASRIHAISQRPFSFDARLL